MVESIGVGPSSNCFLFSVFSSTFLFAEPPKITVFPGTAEVIKGLNLTLFCNATGDPGPWLKWTKHGDLSVLSQAASYTLSSIERPGFPNDTISYTCTASNGYGEPIFKTATSTVKVICEYFN